MKFKLVSCFLLLAAYLVGIAQADLSDCIKATCRVSNDSGMGSGCAIEITDGNVYIITNAHVATTSVMYVEFWTDGHQSQKLAGSTILRSESRDVALVSVPVKDFGKYVPKIIPLASPDYVLQPGQTVMSVGCAQGHWASAWRGHVIGYSDYGDNDVEFMPAPENGRSGSAIFDDNGTIVVSLLHARTGSEVNSSRGLAVNLQNVYAAIYADKVKTNYVVNDREVYWPPRELAQCGPGGCPPRRQPSQPPKRVLPYREQQDDINRDLDKRIRDLYPTLPVKPETKPEAKPEVPSVPSVPVAPEEPKFPVGLLLSLCAVCAAIGGFFGLVFQWKIAHFSKR